MELTDYFDIRHRLHEHPQTAGDEQYAHDTIVRHLQGLHPDKVYTHVGGYGVIAVWMAKDSSPDSGEVPEGRRGIKDSSPYEGEVPEGRRGAKDSSPYEGEVPEGRRGTPTIAFRADTDALPIGHRCGHDGHTTILLRLAELIDSYVCCNTVATHKTVATHNILLLWQPAEETGTGARAVLESGILQQYNIQAFYAMHNMPGYALGTVVVCPHTFAAASTGVVYHLDGRETHASTPEMGLNPGMAVVEIINWFNGFNGGSGDFRQSTLICVRLGEPAFGTSAGHAEVMFTLRAFTNAAMERLLAEANATVDAVASAHGLTVDRLLVEPFHATENAAEGVEAIERAAREESLAVAVQELPNRWSEDCAEYLMLYRGAMFGMGSGVEHAELHHPDYDFPDELIESAARLFFRLAVQA